MPGVAAIHGTAGLKQVELDKLPWHQNPPGQQCGGIMQLCATLLLLEYTSICADGMACLKMQLPNAV